MLKTYFFLIEHIIVLFNAFQCLAPFELTFWHQLFGFSVLMVIKFYYEGHRFNLPFFILAQLILLIHQGFIAMIIGVGLAYYGIRYFPVYKYSKPSGHFKVGYKTLNYKGLDAAVLYPTQEKTRDTAYNPGPMHWVRFFEIMNYEYFVHNFMNLFSFRLLLSYLDHLNIDVNLNSKIAKVEKGHKFPVVVFSGGFSANKHVYIAHMRELASHGIISICIDHDEKLYYPTVSKAVELFPQLKEKMTARQDEIQTCLDFVYDKQANKKFFGNDEFEINYNKVFGSGHSFGGATVVNLAIREPRIKAIIVCDPWMISTEEKIKRTAYNKPLLLVKSYMYEEKAEERDHINMFMKNQPNALYLNHSHSTHNVVTDMILYMPRELQLFDMLYNQNGLEDFHTTSFRLHQAFFQTIGNDDLSNMKPRDQCRVAYDRFQKNLAITSECKNPYSIYQL